MTGLTEAADLAVIVKLTRTTLLVAVAIVFTVISIKEKSKTENLATDGGSVSKESGEQKSLMSVVIKVFPMFILGFIVMAILNTFGVFPSSMGGFFKKGYKFLVTTALVGVGFKINIKDLLTKGVKPIILGGCTWAMLAIFSSIYISFIL